MLYSHFDYVTISNEGMMSMEQQKFSHGGKRAGAGRKLKYGQSTKVIRLPEELVIELRKLNKQDVERLIEKLREYNLKQSKMAHKAN